MPPLAGDQPHVARVADAGAVAVQDLLGLVNRFHQDDRAVELAGADQPAPGRRLHVAPQARADVAHDLHAIAVAYAQLLDGGAMAVVGIGGHLRVRIMTRAPSPPAGLHRLHAR